MNCLNAGVADAGAAGETWVEPLVSDLLASSAGALLHDQQQTLHPMTNLVMVPPLTLPELLLEFLVVLAFDTYEV